MTNDAIPDCPASTFTEGGWYVVGGVRVLRLDPVGKCVWVRARVNVNGVWSTVDVSWPWAWLTERMGEDGLD